MLPSKTVVVGMIAFGVGAVGSVKFPLAATLLRQPQQQLPISATTSPDGVTFQNLTSDSTFVVVGLSEEGATGLTRDTGNVRMSTRPSVFLAYQVTRRFIYRGDKLGECGPISECPLPPPCPPPGNCPWRVVQVSELKPKTP
jgi:hypothetical protein